VLKKHSHILKEKIKEKAKGRRNGQSVCIGFEKKGDGIREIREKSRSSQIFQFGEENNLRIREKATRMKIGYD
jgi:hypothetical protein